MFLKEIIIDGFKSYSKRAHITSFSSCFNAITGLNGTGKSNILDAICFVLGIRSLLQLRVNKLDELVYKQGQAGITKATVSLIFNNECKESSPALYKHLDQINITRQIVIGGRDRYLLNGVSMKPGDIHNLFLSVQLNINNPHFLIMQGRITKIINMKPKEILGLIEETAGTKIYEVKRLESERKISKKQIKLEEIEKLVDEEIEPTIKSLRKEKQEYERFTEISTKLENEQLNYIIQNYFHTLYYFNNGNEKIENDRKKLIEMENKKNSNLKELNQIQINLKKYKNNNDETILIELKKNLKDAEKNLTIEKTNYEDKENEHKKIQNNLIKAQNKLQKLSMELNNIKSDKTIATKLEKDEILEQTVQNYKTEIQTLEKKIEGIRSGNETEDAKSLKIKLMEYQTEKKELQTEYDNLETSLKQYKIEHQQFNKNVKNNKEINNIKQMDDVILKMEEEIQKSENYINQTLKQQNLEFNEKKVKISEINKELQLLEDTEQRSYTYLKQHVEAYESNSDVFGVAFKLFHVKEELLNYSLALEEAAKGKLYNIVVKDDTVAQKVIQNSQKRITCIPLNKIISNDISNEKVSNAKKMLKLDENSVNIIKPLDVIKYEKSVERAIKYVFGASILCKDSTIAKTLSQDYRLLSITEAGDVYNPSGTISGGSKAGMNNLLQNFHKYDNIKSKISHLKSEKTEILKELEKLEKIHVEYERVYAEAESKKIKLGGYKDRRDLIKKQSGNDLQQINEKIGNTEQKQENIKKELELNLGKIKNMEIEIKDRSKNKNERLQKYQDDLKNLKNNLKTDENEFKKFRIEISEVKDKTILLSQNIKDLEEDILKINVKLNDDTKSLQSFKENFEKMEIKKQNLKQQLEEEQEKYENENKIASNLLNKKVKLENENDEIDTSTKKVKNINKICLD